MSTHYQFDIGLAQECGLDEAIMIHNFQFWIRKNRANDVHCHDGRTWTYNTQAAFARLFPFWSRRNIQRILKSLTEQDILITGNYSPDKSDRTTWYAFEDEERFIIEKQHCTKPCNEEKQRVSDNDSKKNQQKQHCTKRCNGSDTIAGKAYHSDPETDVENPHSTKPCNGGNPHSTKRCNGGNPHCTKRCNVYTDKKHSSLLERKGGEDSVERARENDPPPYQFDKSYYVTLQQKKRTEKLDPEELDYCEWFEDEQKRRCIKSKPKASPPEDPPPPPKPLPPRETTPEMHRQWGRVKERARQAEGELTWRSWIKPLELHAVVDNHVLLTSPSQFNADFVLKHHLPAMAADWQEINPDIKSITVRARS